MLPRGGTFSRRGPGVIGHRLAASLYSLPMRMIGQIADPAAAGRFADFLLTLEIASHIEAGQDGGQQVWVEDDDHLDRGRSELAAFRADPTDAKYDGVTGRARKIRKQVQADRQRRQKKFVDVRTQFAASRSGARLTLLLVGLCLLGALLTGLGRSDGPLLRALNFVAFFRDPATGQWTWSIWHDLARGQVWRLITPCFVHIGVLHLLFNMSWLVSIGGLIETRKGTLYFLLLFLASAVFSNFAQYYWSTWNHQPPFGFGMSGVIYAFFGFVWMKSRFEPQAGLAIGQQTVVLMVGWLFLCMTGALGPIGNGAHVGGLIFGVIVGYWPTLRRRMRA